MRGILLMFKLHNNKELNLPVKLSYEDRIELINNEILNHKKYEDYYNKNSLKLTELQIDNIKKRWIGVKKVNNPYPDETLKTSFDILSTYLIYSKDYSVLKEINRFSQLMIKKNSKRKQDELTEQEEKELSKLRKNVLFYKIISK